jgi:hypothetical protein
MGGVTELVLVLSGYEAIHATLGSTRRMKYTLCRVRKMSSKPVNPYGNMGVNAT